MNTQQPKQHTPLFLLRLRNHLLLWYSLILGGTLLFFGVTLYLSVHQILLGTVEKELVEQVQTIKARWSQQQHPPMCITQQDTFIPVRSTNDLPSPTILRGRLFLQSCFDAQGRPLMSFQTATRENSLALKALQEERATDTIDAGNTLGKLYRYAEVLRDPQTGQIVGVLQISETIANQEAILRLLLILLLVLGTIAIGTVLFGGQFLAERAMLPAKLAWSRQQSFIADASHELRTPLTLLRANADVLLRHRERFHEDDLELIEDIVFETEHMARLASNMLTLARLDANTAHHERDVVHIAAIAAHVVKRAQSLAHEQHVTLETQIRQEDATLFVIGDKVLLEQAIMILLDNALKYNRQHGSITIALYQEHNQVHICIQDTGMGIAAEHIPLLTERFYRVDKARSQEDGGTGLGLAIAHSIIHAHQGQLQIQSKLNHGTTATIVLPTAANDKV